MVLADTQGTKIHATVKKNLMNRFENKITQGEWRSVENFGLSFAGGKFKPTGHRYKMSFMTQTVVARIDPLSDEPYLSLSRFDSVISENLNPNFLIDIVGQVVNVGAMETIDVNNKPTNKIDVELRDESDVRLTCTLWGSFADQIYAACQDIDVEMVICLLRFAKIKIYNDVRTIANAFNASQLTINPEYGQIVEFKNKLPNDGHALTLLESKPKRELQLANNGEFYAQHVNGTIQDILNSIEVGKVKLICTSYAIDCDWAWYYIACKKCNKKVSKEKSTTNGNAFVTQKQKWQCDTCHAQVTNILARFKTHVKVMDQTGQMKLMFFDSPAVEIVGCTANSLIEGPFDEMEDLENLPAAIRNLVGKTYQLLISIENDNLWNELDTYKVSKVLSKDGTNDDDVTELSHGGDNPTDDSTGDQVTLLLTSSEEASESTTPSSNRSTGDSVVPLDNASATKKLCLDHIKVVNIKQEKLTKGEIIA
ncbi:PREDICTED: replication protein A 70 kDa DNA-binding subunit B-like [Camelina sativa]|uniref:Replication protein A 70 kDa DNA-binding subunit B-like n=1 Tax=Camelina sativa TaxID=90675 RepID=A0ABM0TEN7_CAMSA|nr:PREDICTED: replication protein A 70 kDa DNA-binding subunit B-like [Camelina sativa]